MTTPIRRQYLAIKKQYPEAIVFFRLGDFYETFDEDAQLIAKELDIVLTSRKISKNQRVPMAGVPHHSAENYIARLIRSGYKVAVCEQLGSTPVDGLVPREVQRVITPGTVVEGTLLNDNENNYLAAIIRGDNRAGLAYIDITTGQFAVTQLHGSDIERLITNELARLKPAEVIGPDEASLTAGRALKIPPSCYEPWRFDQDHARRELQQHFDVG
ncbi:MAG TPA: DNA mismatch repair protein MutS, partial [Anaerolineae bacterium]|nr:DNA mismatch repair protein MutS [Anaerolineae bacterium]